MKLNTGGYHNVATGNLALMKNTQGHDNSAYGHLALSNATGSRNVALGSGAGQNLTTGSNNVDIANPGVAGESGTIRIGTASQTAAYLAGVWNKTIGGPTKAVVINKNGRLGTAPAPAAPLSGKSQTLSRLRARCFGSSGPRTAAERRDPAASRAGAERRLNRTVHGPRSRRAAGVAPALLLCAKSRSDPSGGAPSSKSHSGTGSKSPR